MLSEKPWRLEAVLVLASGLMFSLLLGLLSTSALQHWLPEGTASDRKFYEFLISTASFHGMALVLLHYFLRQHSVAWGEFVGLFGPRLSRALRLGVLLAALALPAVLVLNKLSAQGISMAFDKEPEVQSPIQVLQVSVALGQRICFGFAAIGLAPAVEEMLFRGILYPLVKQFGHPAWALWGSSLLFAAIHSNMMTFVPLTFLALMLVWLYERTDNLLAPITAHALFNAANFFLFLYGPELARWWTWLRERI